MKVTNAHGNPVSGVTVAFSVTAGGGSVSGGSKTTDTGGIATADTWTLGTTPGSNTLSASVVGVPTAVTITATALAAVIVVQNTTDLVNGDVGDPLRLLQSPGADGISLREAILAANAGAVPFEITFSPDLAGKTIALTASLPDIRRDGVRLIGRTAADGTPGITLDGAAITVCCTRPMLGIQASHITVKHLRFVNVRNRNRGISVLVGPPGGTTPRSVGPLEITDIRISRNAFDNGTSTEDADAITLGADNGVAVGTRILRVTIDSNTFNHFQGDADNIHVQGGGTSGLIRDVNIFDNVFVDCALCIELTLYQSNNTIRNTRVIRNSFTGSVVFSVVLLISRHEGAGTGNTIDSTLVSGNTFKRGRELEVDATIFDGAVGNTISATSIVNNVIDGSARGIQLNAGSRPATTNNRIVSTAIERNRFTAIPGFWLELYAGNFGAADNVLAGTTFANNIVERSPRGMLIIGGSGGGGNRLEDTRIINNTFYLHNQAVTMLVNHNASGNAVTGFEIVNSIFWSPGSTGSQEFQGDVAPSNVSYSITRMPGYAAAGNLDVDPLFVAADAGDYRLRPGSPAIGAGRAMGSPTADFACYPRTGLPDIGALAFGSTGNQCTVGVPSLVHARRWEAQQEEEAQEVRGTGTTAAVPATVTNRADAGGRSRTRRHAKSLKINGASVR